MQAVFKTRQICVGFKIFLNYIQEYDGLVKNKIPRNTTRILILRTIIKLYELGTHVDSCIAI